MHVSGGSLRETLVDREVDGMDRAEKCFFCGSNTPEDDLVAWFVQSERRVTHTGCWLVNHRSEQSTFSAGPHQAPEKTLDDIRRELEAEYPSATKNGDLREPHAAPLPVLVPSDSEEDVGAIERPRAASRRRRWRGYAMPVLVAGVAAQVLLVVIYFWMSRDVIWPGAVAGAPEVNASAVEPRGAPSAAVVSPALQELKALRAELHDLGARLERAESRLVGMQARVSGVESSTRRLGNEVASAAVSRRAERGVPEPRQRAAKPPGPVTTDSGGWIPSEPAARDTSFATHAERATTEGAPSREARGLPDDTSPTAAPAELRDKLRAEWRMIKQGFASTGEDLRRSVRALVHKVSRD